MKVVPVPVRSDNYAYLLIDSSSNQTLVVDPYDVSKVQAALDKEGITDKSLVKGIITTHHHDDHAGGNLEFVSIHGFLCAMVLYMRCVTADQTVDKVSKYPGVTVYGGSKQVAGLTQQVKDKDTLKLGDVDIRCATYLVAARCRGVTVQSGN